MFDNKLFKDAEEVKSRLQDFGVSTEDLIKIVHAAAGGRNSSVANDPKTAGGQFAYIYGTRALRDVFLPLDWKRDRHDNIESVINPTKGIKIIFQNVDNAADPLRTPKALSSKGTASARVVDFAQPNLTNFSEIFPKDSGGKKKSNTSVWFFCVSVDGDNVRAELSRPYSLEGGQFGEFMERIFIVQGEDGDSWNNLNISLEDDNDLDEFEVNISRK